MGLGLLRVLGGGNIGSHYTKGDVFRNMDLEQGPNVILHGGVCGKNEIFYRKRKGLLEGRSENFLR